MAHSSSSQTHRSAGSHNAVEAEIDLERIATQPDVIEVYSKTYGWIGWAIVAIAISMSLFQLATAVPVTMNAMQHRAMHLTFGMVLVFLMYPTIPRLSGGRTNAFDITLSVLSAISFGYLVYMYEDIARRAMNVTTLDLSMGAIGIVLVLEGARRSIGYQLPLIAVICLAYAIAGPYLPDIIAHRGISVSSLIDRMYLGNEGILGIALGVSATYVFLFILFGAFLNGTGMSGLFTNAAVAVAGHRPGGPAKVSILTSGLLGMINGSAVANVATTGVFTIPLMEKVGYRKRFASGVEAVASTGGQFTPPIMGAAAFIMAEFLSIPYTDIIIAATIPAFLYFMALWIMVHYQARKAGLEGLRRDQLPALLPILRQRGHLLLPIFLLLALLFADFTPIFAAFYATIGTLAVSYLRKETRMSLRQIAEILTGAATGAVFIVMATAVVGIIVGVVSLTGIGLQLANGILTLAQGMLLPTLVLTMLACIVLGMGLPTTACYIVAVVVAGPALTRLGVEPLVAHLFVLYFAVLSNITPPVALASYTAAGVSGANPTEVSWTALKLGLAGFIVPFMFVYSPEILLQGDSFIANLRAACTAGIGVYVLAVGIIGFWFTRLTLVERLLLFAAAFGLMEGGLTGDTGGLLAIAVVAAVQRLRLRARPAERLTVSR